MSLRNWPVSSVLLIFVSLVLLETCALVVTQASIPSNIDFLFYSQFDLYQTLFNADPRTALKYIFLEKPIVMILRVDPASQTFVWGQYYYLANLLLLVLLSTLIFLSLRRNVFKQCLPWIILIWLCLFYIRVASCCGADAYWWVEVVVRYVLLDPQGSFYHYVEIYEQIKLGIQSIQMVVFVVAMLMLFRKLRAAG